MPAPSNWTDDKSALLEKLWAEGLPASEIADRIPGFSRNAIIGKAHRMGLTSRPSPIVRHPTRAATLNPGLKQCQWPHGDPRDDDFHFCGAPVFAHAPYCKEHLLLAHRKVGEKAA